MCPPGGIFSPTASSWGLMPAMVAFAWFGGGVPFGGPTLDLRRSAPLFFSLLCGVFRSSFLFLVGVPVPAFMCLLLLCPRGPVGWCVAYRPGTFAMYTTGASPALALSRDTAGWVCVGYPVHVRCLAAWLRRSQ